jgi:pimeloyl-ACP methyl ester carboxylesterase
LFERLRADADVILLDQRGTGLSRPTVDCPAGAPPAPDFLATNESLLSALRAVYGPCAGHWRSQGVPAELFTVAAVAADVERIRRQLGVPRISLLGFSYGSRLALEYAARYPAHVERLVLQGPMGFEHGARLPATLDAVLSRVSALAAVDSTARALVPDLRVALRDRLAALEQAPVRVVVRRSSGDSVHVVVGKEGLQALVAGRAADPRIPALLSSLAGGDTRVLAQLVAGIYNDLAAGGGSLFGRALYCSAPAPAARLQRAAAQATGSLTGAVFDNAPSTAEFCRALGITPGAPPARTSPLDVSALLITGTLDDRTPVENVAEVETYFRNAQSLIVDNGGHELLPYDTVQAAVLEFFATGAVRTMRLAVPPPNFPTIEQALQPPRRGR